MSDNIERLSAWFSSANSHQLGGSIGLEVETSFVNESGNPITLAQSQSIFKALCLRGWKPVCAKNGLLTELSSGGGDRLLYDLGRQNLEISTASGSPQFVSVRIQECLETVYVAGRETGAYPFFGPVLSSDEDLLVIPDERDANWLKLDGRSSLNLLARTSSVQVTIDVPLPDAIPVINRLWSKAKTFAADYPQDANWRQYIAESFAPYRLDRYAGPRWFDDLDDYCRELCRHDVVQDGRLVPQSAAGNYDIGLFIRSVWWWFRLRRHGEKLCIEIRPMPRRSDDTIALQISAALSSAGM